MALMRLRAAFQANSRLSALGFSSLPRYSESQGSMVSDEGEGPIRGASSNRGSGADEDVGAGVTAFVAEKATEVTRKAAETAVEVGERAKETVDDALGAGGDGLPDNGLSGGT